MKTIQTLSAIGASVALLAAATAQVAGAVSPSPSCAALNDAVSQVEHTNGASLMSPWSSELTAARSQGYTQDLKKAFLGSTTSATGLIGVHRLYKSSTNDFLYTKSQTEVTSAKGNGYSDQGVRFYASQTDLGCTDPVLRFVKNNQHRLAATPADASALSAAGWRQETVAFYAGPTDTGTNPTEPPSPPPTDPPTTEPGTFTFAVIPDTQVEVLKATDTRLAGRSKYLVSQKVAFAAQTGDLVNWDTAAHEQYQRAKTGMNVLTSNKIPYTVAVGNHDTNLTDVGGSARPGKAWEMIRDTRTLNQYFKASDFGNVGGAFEAGKIDNVYATYEAGGKKWMVITLEMAARKTAIEWARDVVATHPDHNVIITTHYYLRSDATIATDTAGYGATAPQYLFDTVVKQYPNVKMVFSGHVGVAKKARVDTGVNGNKIYSFLTTFHEGTTNPVRMVKVDTVNNTISSTIYGPLTLKTWPVYDETITGLKFQ